MKMYFTVLDVNEYKPVFSNETDKKIYIKENLSVDDVVVKLKATDADINSTVSLI